MSFIAHPVVYVLTYVLLMLPTYYLPYLGSNSATLGLLSFATGQGIYLPFLLHLGFLIVLVVLAWIRGAWINRKWVIVFPFLAMVFDLTPGLSLIPGIPTTMHLFAIIIGVAGTTPRNRQAARSETSPLHAPVPETPEQSAPLQGSSLPGRGSLRAEPMEAEPFTGGTTVKTAAEQIVDDARNPIYGPEIQASHDPVVPEVGSPRSSNEASLSNINRPRVVVEAVSPAGTERAERKLVAVLAADVVGYSRLMGADEEGTLSALNAVRREITDPTIEEHRGRIVKTLGDGLLVEFASVVDAVRCAVEVQRKLAARNLDIAAEKRILFRIGINLGDIIVDDADIFGDGVNVAARLEALAEPGGICVSQAVRDQVRDKLSFGFEDMGQQQVKNIARPVHIFRIFLETGVGDILKPEPPRVNGATAKIAAPETKASAAATWPYRAAPRKTLFAWALAALGSVGAAVALWLWTGGMNAAPRPKPSPVIGGPLLFEKDRVVLIPSAGETLAEQARFLHDNPLVTVVIAASCAREEGGRAGAAVLAQLRANRIRDALAKLGVASTRMTTENACNASGDARLAGDVFRARDGQVFVLWK